MLLLQAYAKEYGKQVEGNVKVNTLTGAPFTIVNMVVYIPDSYSIVTLYFCANM